MSVMAAPPPPPDTRPDPSTVSKRSDTPFIPGVRCAGKSKKAGGARCPKWAVSGATVCREHGGAAPQVKAKAAERLAEAASEYRVGVMLARMNLEADPVHDPASALARMAGRYLSGFEQVQGKINAAREAGRVPNETDMDDRKFLAKELRTILTDMTRLQVGVQLASRYGSAESVEDVIDGEVAELVDAPDVSEIVRRVLATEHELETERLVRVEQAKQGQLPAGLTIVGETEQAS